MLPGNELFKSFISINWLLFDRSLPYRCSIRSWWNINRARWSRQGRYVGIFYLDQVNCNNWLITSNGAFCSFVFTFEIVWKVLLRWLFSCSCFWVVGICSSTVIFNEHTLSTWQFASLYLSYGRHNNTLCPRSQGYKFSLRNIGPGTVKVE